MLEDWGNVVIAVLSVCTACIAVAEFYGGKELQAWLKGRLEDWWIRLADVRALNIGRTEAAYTSTLLRRVLGRTVSVKRMSISVVAAITSVGGALAHLWFSSLRDPSPWFWHFVGDITDQLIIASSTFAVFTFVSLGITYEIATRSVNWFHHRRLGSLYFVTIVVITSVISEVLLRVVVRISDWVMQAQIVSDGDATITMISIEKGYVPSMALYALGHTLFWLRLFMFGSFILWIMAGWSLAWLKQTIYRLFEAEKGALTVFSGAITAASAGVKWAMENWT